MAKCPQLKQTTPLPLDETSDILSKVKQINRTLVDLGEGKEFAQVLDQILDRVYSDILKPILAANIKDEQSSKR